MRHNPGRLGSLVILVSLAGLGLGLGALVSCNEYSLVTLESFVDVVRDESVLVRGETKFDVLWVVDNSTSMCQEQSNLTRNFSLFVERLTRLNADFRMGVITTDVVNAGQQGELQNVPAVDLRNCIQATPDEESNYCTADGDCGIGGCLCGLPRLQRCASDAECGGDTPVCVRSAADAALRFCSRTCSGPADASCMHPSDPNGVFQCGESPDQPGALHCVLRSCSGDAQCPAAEMGGSGFPLFEYACLPDGADAGRSYCRRRENFNVPCRAGRECPHGGACNEQGKCPTYMVCPAPTCDCPQRLDRVLTIADVADNPSALDDAVRRFRCMASVGTDGDPTERGLEAIEMFLERDAAKPEAGRFLREDAHLVIILLSDEDDCSGYDEALEWFESEYAQVRLQQCPEIPEQPENISFGVCDWYKERLVPATQTAERVLASKPEGYKVVVATIVGAADVFCADACPNEGGSNCVPSDACVGTCAAPGFCAQRVFRHDICAQAGEGRQQSCASDNGIAYAGDRYMQFTRAFDDFGVSISICQDDFSEALGRVAGLIENVGVNYCLSGNLESCRADSDCYESADLGKSRCGSYWSPNWERGVGRCVGREDGQPPLPNGCRDDEECGVGGRCDIRNICRWDVAHGGRPASLKVTIRRAGAEERQTMNPAGDWNFVPDQDYGCLTFSGAAAPAPADDVQILYVSDVRP